MLVAKLACILHAEHHINICITQCSASFSLMLPEEGGKGIHRRR